MTHVRGPKGLRNKEDDSKLDGLKLSALIDELKTRPAWPLPVLQEDAASIEALITVLIDNGVLKDGPVKVYSQDGAMVETHLTAAEKVLKYVEQYRSTLSGLVMLLVDDGLITENQMDLAVLAFHHAQNVYSNRPTNNYLDYRKFMVSVYRDLKNTGLVLEWKPDTKNL